MRVGAIKILKQVYTDLGICRRNPEGNGLYSLIVEEELLNDAQNRLTKKKITNDEDENMKGKP